jgi:hypothetical protein
MIRKKAIFDRLIHFTIKKISKVCIIAFVLINILAVNPPDTKVENTRFIVKNTHFEGSPAKKKMWKLLGTYAPDGYTIIDDCLKAPCSYGGVTISGYNKGFSSFIDSSSEKALIGSANTVVHEMCHSYTSRLYLKLLKDKGISPDLNYNAFYLGNRTSNLVKRTDVFVTKEMDAVFPEKLKTFRYKTYVCPSEKIQSAQQYGCYGLLDELNAYYWGTKTSYDLYEYYRTKKNNREGWLSFFSDFYSSSFAYLEFKCYIISYMMYAQDKHKKEYKEILNNKEFLCTLQKVDDNWWVLLTDFKKLKTKIIADLKKRNIKSSQKGNFFYIGNSGIGDQSETYELLRIELKAVKYQEMAKLLGLRNSSGPDIYQ